MSVKTLIVLLLIILISVVGYQVLPVLYKGYITIPAVCKEGAEVYKKYGMRYMRTDMATKLAGLGVPRHKKDIYVELDKDNVYVTIVYEDWVNFYDYYERDFYFEHTCIGERKSLYYRN